MSVVQTLPSSVQGVPPGTAQLSVVSLQVLLLHSPPPVQGSPAWFEQRRVLLQVSAPLQKIPSSQLPTGVCQSLVSVHVAPFVSVPVVNVGPTESATVVPLPSLRPQRATRPVPEVSCAFMLF